MSLKLTYASIVAAAVLISPALASSQEEVNQCLTEIKKAPEAVDAKLKYKGARGASVKSYKFEMKKGDHKTMVTCKVKRGEIVEIVWQ